MPVAPRKPCRSPGCKKLTVDSFCDVHAHQRQISQRVERIKYDNERGTAASRGYDSRWSRYAKQHRIDNPLCVSCEAAGKLVMAQCVDHIVPVKDKDDPLFWDRSNHQSLCNKCHSIKTAEEDGGFGNERKTNGRFG